MDTELKRSVQLVKMDALARMSASLSHDLNNMLGAIEGYATLLLNSMSAEDPSRSDVEEIYKAERRAADIIRQLMLFSRGGAGRRISVDIGELVAGLVKNAQSAAGSEIVFEVSCPASLKPVCVDPALLEQALMNLVLNAKDAMPFGGRIRIHAENADLNGAAPRSPRPDEATTGYIRLSVSDNGCGMPQEVIDRLFEPFFTTKPKGKGTGLGLSAVYGVVKRHNGWIEVSSEPGKGSAFTVYLPQAPAETA